MAERDAGEITRDFDVIQIFRAKSDYLSAVSPVIATYRSVQNSHLRISLYEFGPWTGKALARLLAWRKSCEGWPKNIWHSLADQITRRLLLKKSIIGEMQECCDAMYDCYPLDLFLQVDKFSSGKLFLLKISSPDGTKGNSATVMLCNDHRRIDGHVWCSVGEQEFGVMADLGFSNVISESSVPEQLLISTTTQCNLNCIHCVSAWTRKGLSRLSTEIQLQIKRWADAGMLKFAHTDYSGDILWSDNRFGGDLDFLLGLGVPFHLNTNGIFLSREVAKRLMGSRIEFLNVSLDAARDETYRRVRKGAPALEKVVANMRGVAEERRLADRSDIRLSISFTLMRSTIGELSEIIALARDIGFDLVIARHLEAYTADVAKESFWWDQESFNEAREDALRLAANLGVTLSIERAFEPRRERRGHRLCREPWTNATLLGNGDVNVCCVPGPGMRMGNLNEQSMEQIWNGPAYQHFRSVVNSSDPPAACRACPMFRKPNNPDSYLPYVVTGDTSASQKASDSQVH